MSTRIVEVREIEAPSALVWEVSVDVERWPEWASNFSSVRRLDDGPFGPTSSARIRQRGIPERTWTMISFEDGRGFAWGAQLMPGVHAVGRHLVEPLDGGTRTRVTLTVELSGIFAPLLGAVARRGLKQEIADLAQAAETRARGAATTEAAP